MSRDIRSFRHPHGMSRVGRAKGSLKGSGLADNPPGLWRPELRHTSTVIDQLRSAAEALGRGDPEPFASLFAEDAEWRGVRRGFFLWRHTPS